MQVSVEAVATPACRLMGAPMGDWLLAGVLLFIAAD